MTKDWNPPTREQILALLRGAGDPMDSDELAEALGVLPAPHKEILNRRLAAMERDGQLLPNRKGVLLLASKLDFIAGRVIGHRDGFGFVRPDDGGPDLFLPPRQMQRAMHGDRVLVKQAGSDDKGRPEGAIVEITDRAHRHIVGRFLNERGVHLVVPEDQRIKHDILIAPAHVGGAKPGQVVTCEIVDPPTRNTQPIGKVIEVLGDLGDSGMEIEIAVRKYDVPHEFPDAVLEQADAMASEVTDKDVAGRVDLRDVPLITIDGEDARDFDDAVYCEPVFSSGKRPRVTGYRLLVAIADVSHYVRPGEALDDSAMTRTTSVYFPRRVIPMLPEKLSNGLCSLNPMTDRLVMVCDMVVSLKGKVRAYQFYEAVMHSAARMTYNQVWKILSGHEEASRTEQSDLCSLSDEDLESCLVNLHDLYRILAATRKERGALEFDTVETKIECDEQGRILRIVPTVRNDAHRLIEECMLAANVCAADFIKRAKHPSLYRSHEGPTKEKLDKLRAFLRTSGLSLSGGSDPSPLDYLELFNKIQGRSDSELLQTMILRSMQQAIYSPDNSGHFGLAYDAYTHFTSPIRRYPDLLVHRVIKACINKTTYVPQLSTGRDAVDQPESESDAATKRGRGGKRKDESDKVAIKAVWDRLGVMCSTNERRADEASRDVMAWLKCQFMRDRVGEEFTGKITGVAPFGIFITLDALYVEGMVHVSELGSEYFQYNESGHALLGERTGMRYRLTDSIRVQVAKVDLESRRIEFRLTTDGGRNSGDKPRHGKKAAPGKSEAVKTAREKRLDARKKKKDSKESKAKPKSKSKAKGKRKGKAKAKARVTKGSTRTDAASGKRKKTSSNKRKGPAKKAIRGKKKRGAKSARRKSR